MKILTYDKFERIDFNFNFESRLSILHPEIKPNVEFIFMTCLNSPRPS